MMGDKASAANLFDEPLESCEKSVEEIKDGATLLHGFVRDETQAILQEITRIGDAAPFRRMVTRGGHRMSVAMTNCGRVGWTSDEKGYRYSAIDPETGLRWPAIPDLFSDFTRRAAAEAGFDGFDPDACLVNRYEPGAKMGLHQDKDEKDFDAPIVSVSLGLPATFLFGGKRRSDPVRRFRLESGDVVVWGGPARLIYHGIAALADGDHPLAGRMRLNLTFRKAL